MTPEVSSAREVGTSEVIANPEVAAVGASVIPEAKTAEVNVSHEGVTGKLVSLWWELPKPVFAMW